MTPFQSRFERVREIQRKRMGKDGTEDIKAEGREETRPKLEKGDGFALFLSAFLTLFLPAAAVLLLLGGLLFLIAHVL